VTRNDFVKKITKTDKNRGARNDFVKKFTKTDARSMFCKICKCMKFTIEEMPKIRPFWSQFSETVSAEIYG
jgi:hypothetical protein